VSPRLLELGRTIVLGLLIPFLAVGCFRGKNGVINGPAPLPQVLEPPPVEPAPRVDGDPICCTDEEPIRPGTKLLAYVHDGKVYHFCSQECLQRFIENPGRYDR
jgi:YHS domain-containing protein